MAEHLSEEALSELLDGGGIEGAEHLAVCGLCQARVDELRGLRTTLRKLPDLTAPGWLWSRIEAGLPRRAGSRRRVRWPRLVAMQAAALAAVFVLGLGLGRTFRSGSGGGQQAAATASGPTQTASTREAAPGSLAEALVDVRKVGAEYDAALRNLERRARQEGAPVGSLGEQRLASLNLLVEASRTALNADPADPVLNAYLFAALEERDEVMRQMGGTPGDGTTVRWR